MFFSMVAIASVVALASVYAVDAIPIHAVVAGTLAAGFALAVLLWADVSPWALTGYRPGSSYPIDRPSPSRVRSFWARLVARVDEPVPIGA